MKYWLITMLFGGSILAQNEAPLLENLSVTYNEAEHSVTVQYDISDNESDPTTVILSVSDNTGESYQYPAGWNGDVGAIEDFDGLKTATWVLDDSIDQFTDYKVKVVAHDNFEIDIASILEDVNDANLLADLLWIEGARHRVSSLEHLNETKSELETRFGDFGYNLWNHSFPFDDNYNSENIIGRKQGIIDEQNTIILDAHFDSVGNSPGADDNGSGVVGMLEIARILESIPLAKSVNFIGFDLEESGLVGSAYYVTDGIRSYETIEAVLNFEMIGFYSDEPNSQVMPDGFEFLFPAATAALESLNNAGIFITNIGNTISTELLNKFASCASDYMPELEVITINVPGNGNIAEDLRRSDHAMFWDAGIPALMITDGANTRNYNYHTADDTVETLDIPFMSNVVKATLATLLELTQPINASVFESDISLNTGLENHIHTIDFSIESTENSHEFIIHSPVTESQKSVEVMDVNGKVFLSFIIPKNETTTRFMVDGGVVQLHLIKLESDNQLNTQKFVTK